MSTLPLRSLLVLMLLPAVAISQAVTNGRSKAIGCATIDVLIVSDLGLHGPVPQARARLLETFAKAQSSFTSAFDVELKMFVRDIILPTHENPFPDPNEEADDMFDVSSHLKVWLNDNGYDLGQYDLVIGAYQTAYDLPYWGYCFSENNMLATIVMRLSGGADLTVRLMAHEIGHAFGGTHDPPGTSLMSPLIDGGGSWSAKNKAEINGFLGLEKTKSYFGKCPTFVLQGIANGTTVTLNWTVNYETDVVGYVMYENGDIIDTVDAKGPSTSPLSYTIEHTPGSDGEIVYWLHQISKWGTILENENAVVTIGNADDIVFGAHPNPFSDTLRVMDVVPGTKVIVYNTLSQRVTEHLAANNIITLETLGWTPGLYFVTNEDRVLRVIRR